MYHIPRIILLAFLYLIATLVYFKNILIANYLLTVSWNG